MAAVLPDADSEFGTRVRARLSSSTVIWLTTTGADGTPQPNPVWFLWSDPDTVLVYNRADAVRLKHIAHRPRVAFNLDGNGGGGDIVVLAGTAELAPDLAAADANADYVAKYGEAMAHVSGSVEAFGAEYPVALRVRIDRIRGH